MSNTRSESLYITLTYWLGVVGGNNFYLRDFKKGIIKIIFCLISICLPILSFDRFMISAGSFIMLIIQLIVLREYLNYKEISNKKNEFQFIQREKKISNNIWYGLGLIMLLLAVLMPAFKIFKIITSA